MAEQGAPVIEFPSDPPRNFQNRLSRVEQVADSRGLIELSNQIESLRQEMRRLRGEVEDQSHRLETLQKRQRELYIDVDRRMGALEGRATAEQEPSPVDEGRSRDAPAAGLATQADKPAAKAGNLPPPPGSIHEGPPPEDVIAEQARHRADPPPGQVAMTAPADEQGSYQQAFSLLKSGNYDQSIASFKDFLARFPNSGNADNAQYWLGEAYYVTRQFEPAITEYTGLIRSYPQSQKLTHALLKIGYSYHELGNIQQAQASLEDLRKRYPGTTAARLAEERLQRIRLEQQ
jgi:tol-pal system protein YbgF